MKFVTFFLAATAATMASAGTTFPRSQKEQTLRLMSYNFRYDSKPDSITVQETIDALPSGLPETPSTYYANTAEKPWSTRRIGITNDILFPQVNVVGMLINMY